MKACFHKKDHVSAVIFAKQMSPREFLILEGLSMLWPHMYSVTCVGSGQFFTLFSSKCCNHYNSFLFITITSDVLIFSSISYMRFSRYIADDPDISFSSNGEYEIRTRDLLLARQALSQLS